MAYTTEMAKLAGKANASSDKIFVTIAPEYFRPILPDLGVGETRDNRLECR
jgi:E3 ubiquitin-protein ligase UHRF1